VVPSLTTIKLLFPDEVIKSISLSQDEAVPVKRTTDTIVRPPFVAIFKVRDPASRY